MVLRVLISKEIVCFAKDIKIENPLRRVLEKG